MTITGNLAISGTGAGAGMDSWQVACSSVANTSSTSNVTISGLSQAVTCPGTAAVYMVSISALITVQASNLVIVELLVDGTAQTAQIQAIGGPGAMGGAYMQTWRITGLSAASHTFTARCPTNPGSGPNNVAATHTLMTIERKA